MNAVVLTFNRWHLGMLGCYGNPWIETPCFDRLAMQSVLFDRHFSPSSAGEATAESWLTGRYSLPASHPVCPPWERLQQADVDVCLCGETRAVKSFARDLLPADGVIEVAGETSPVAQLHDWPFPQLVSQVQQLADELPQDVGNRLLWLWSAGIGEPWLTPREVAVLYLDEEDDLPEDVADAVQHVVNGEKLFGKRRSAMDQFLKTHAQAPPQGLSTEEEIRHWNFARRIYAGWASWQDQLLEAMIESLEPLLDSAPSLLIVAAGNGVWLGEQTREQTKQCRLHEEFLHTPLLICEWEREEIGSRRQSLVSTVDLLPTLFDWFDVPYREDEFDGRSLLPIVHGETEQVREELFHADACGSTGVRNSEFYLLAPSTGTGADRSGETADRGLYLKPEDIWEQHDVAAQYPHEADALNARFRPLA